MHELFWFDSISEGLVFIAAQLVILAIALFYEYRRKVIEEKQNL